jgi:ribonuclease-3
MENTQGDLKRETPQEFAVRVGLQFTDQLVLNRALTHRSYLNEHHEALEDNERLEFLGDAVLDFLVGSWLYNRYPELPEGNLTRLRSALVRTEQLAVFAEDLNLGQAILLGKGEEEAGGRKRPSLLCACFEALIGAIYLDSDFNSVQEFMRPMLEPAASAVLIEQRDKDPKSLLQEWAQSQGRGTPTYRTNSSYGPDHAKIFEVNVYLNGEDLGRGVGHSKQSAAKAAAKTALEILDVK